VQRLEKEIQFLKEELSMCNKLVRTNTCTFRICAFYSQHNYHINTWKPHSGFPSFDFGLHGYFSVFL